MNQIHRIVACCALALLAVSCLGKNRSGETEDVGLPDSFSVLTLNMWHGGDAGKRPLEDTATMLRRLGADATCLQETRGLGVGWPDNGKVLADQLGWNYAAFSGNRGIATRHPIVERTKNSVVVQLPSGRRVQVACVHLPPAPYQPYQLLEIPYQDAPFLSTAEQAVAAARAARGANVESLLLDLEDALDDETPLVVGGDFNEPSHLDWTSGAKAAGACPLAVEWPTSAKLAEAGLVDSWRTLHPDPLAWPGLTWTPTTSPDDPKDRHDRIDWLLHAGGGIKPLRVRLVGESSATCEVVFKSWPSDHRAVLATYILTGDPEQ